MNQPSLKQHGTHADLMLSVCPFITQRLCARGKIWSVCIPLLSTWKLRPLEIYMYIVGSWAASIYMYYTESCSAVNDIYPANCAQSRKQMACSQQVDGRGYDGELKDTVHDAHGPCQMIQSILKLAVCWFRQISWFMSRMLTPSIFYKWWWKVLKSKTICYRRLEWWLVLEMHCVVHVAIPNYHVCDHFTSCIRSREYLTCFVWHFLWVFSCDSRCQY